MLGLEEVAAHFDSTPKNWLIRIDLPLERRVELHRAETRRANDLKDAIALKVDIVVTASVTFDYRPHFTWCRFPKESLPISSWRSDG